MGIAQPLAAIADGFSSYQILLLLFLKILGSIAIGAVFGFALVYLSRLARTRSLLLVLVLGTIIACVGLTLLLDISEILANMVIGFIVVNKARREEMLKVIDDIEDVIFAMFFVLAGLHFDLAVMTTAGLLALLIVVGRFAGKYLGTRTGAVIARSPEPVKKYLGLALLPKAGVTIGLALLVERAFPTFGAVVYNGIFASVIINELIAPPLVKFAISRAGERKSE
jgi:Kef-type K+ transport system membrane component KefB